MKNAELFNWCTTYQELARILLINVEVFKINFQLTIFVKAKGAKGNEATVIILKSLFTIVD
jgi:hypothetical protein